MTYNIMDAENRKSIDFSNVITIINLIKLLIVKTFKAF